jgi:bla regulator protein blaR1
MGLFDATDIWIVALGKTTVHSIWIGMLVFALLRFMLIYISNKFSNLRYWISVSALLFLFASVIVTFFLLYDPSISMQRAGFLRDLIPSIYGNLRIEDSDNAGIGIHSIFSIFGEIYFIGSFAMLIRSGVSLTQIRQLRKSGSRVAPDWQARLLQISSSLGIRRSVDFLESDRIKGPLLAGFIKPAIIIPAGMVTNLPFSQIETILMHELYHLKRRDHLVNIVQLFIEGILFYHPLVWLISGIVRNEREHCCDDEVLRRTKNPINYAKALIHIAEQQHFSRLLPGAAGTTKHHLKFRIHRILKTNTMKTNMRDKIISLALLAGTVIVLLAVSSFSAGPSFIRSGLIMDDMAIAPEEKPMITVSDTIPQTKPEAINEKAGEIDWEEMKAVVEEARKEALKEIEEIDWEEMKAQVEEAQQEALKEIKEIDWEQMKEEMEEARQEALKEIKEIDWEQMKAEVEEARQEALKEIKEIDWEQMKEELTKSISEIHIDLEQMKRDIKNSMDEIHRDKIDMEKDMEMDMEKDMEMNLDMEMDMELDMEMDMEKSMETEVSLGIELNH